MPLDEPVDEALLVVELEDDVEEAVPDELVDVEVLKDEVLGTGSIGPVALSKFYTARPLV